MRNGDKEISKTWGDNPKSKNTIRWQRREERGRTEDVGSLRLRGLIAENSGEAERAKNAGLQLDPPGLLYLLSSMGDIIQEPGCGVRTGSSPIKTSPRGLDRGLVDHT